MYITKHTNIIHMGDASTAFDSQFEIKPHNTPVLQEINVIIHCYFKDDVTSKLNIVYKGKKDSTELHRN